jgi:tetratricopeptide (TPR) repeat protein
MTLSRCASWACLFILVFGATPAPARASKLNLPPETTAILDKIYSFDLDGAVEAAKRMQQQQPGHPLGYLLEAEALWWRMWCISAEFKYGMSDARRRAKLATDQHYFDLSAKASALAEEQLKQRESAEMQLYAGMADAAAARLYALRGENRNTARAGVRAREHLLRAKALDADLADADMGLGLYNYYVDTLGAIAKILRFFMGIPGGAKQDGVRLLEHAMAECVLTPSVARFYLAINLHRYDQQYEKALGVISPLAEKYPSNPVFQLARGDLYAKLGRKQQALLCYRAAAAVAVHDEECRTHIQELVRVSLAALGANNTSNGNSGSPESALTSSPSRW